MSRPIRITVTVIGLLLVAFALVVAVYANEPFNIATLFGIAGVALIVWARRQSTVADSRQ